MHSHQTCVCMHGLSLDEPLMGAFRGQRYDTMDAMVVTLPACAAMSLQGAQWLVQISQWIAHSVHIKTAFGCPVHSREFQV